METRTLSPLSAAGKPRRLFLNGLAAALMLCGSLVPAAAQTSANPPVQNTDSLYIGDTGDNSVKRFTADGTFLGNFVTHQTTGLRGPGGLIFDSEGDLILSNQNVNTGVNGEILRFDSNGTELAPLVDKQSPNAPVAPRGVVLWQGNYFVADVTTSLLDNKTLAPGRVLKYTGDGQLVATLTPPASAFSGDFHPRGVVIGPDGLLYVANAPNLLPTSNNSPPTSGLGGQVLRFDPATGAFKDVFINSIGGAIPSCNCTDELNRPDGLVFGPNDGKLYVTSFRNPANPDQDTDKILIFSGPGAGGNAGKFAGQIELYEAGTGAASRRYAQALLFGPGGALFVPISNTGEVRRYDVTKRTFDVLVPAASQGGSLLLPFYLTFGRTRPGTLSYPASR